MQKEVRFGGLATNPSDYDAADGQLATSVNLVNEDGALRPVWQPEVVGAALLDYHIMYLHANNDYRHYILYNGNLMAVYWINESDLLDTQAETFDPVFIMDVESRVISVNAIGNTLVMLCDDGMHYILWKNSDYLYLGQKPPELQIQFDVTGTWAENYPGVFSAWAGNGKGYAAYSTEFSVNAVEALINETHRIISDANHFYAPFNIRYCYRLFDGSMVMHSAPVFMPIAVPYTLFVEYAHYFMYNGVFAPAPYYEIGESNEVEISSAMATAIRYQPNNVALKYKAAQINLGNWGDIVKSVDVFVTPPIFRETSLNGSMTFKGDTLKYHYAYHAVTDPDGYTSLDVRQNKLRVDTVDNIDYSQRFVLDYPMLTEAEYLEKIKSSSTFYKIASFDLEKGELEYDAWNELPIKTGVLNTLTSQEAMVDDYRTHNILVPHYDDENTYASLSSYNNRLNVSGADDKLFEGFDLRTMVPYDSRVEFGDHSHGRWWQVEKVVVYIQTEGGEKIVEHEIETKVWQAALVNQPLFYPDRRAKKMLLKIVTSITVLPDHTTVKNYTWYKFDMMESPMLNGAYTTGGVYADLSTDTGHNPLPDSVASPEPIPAGSDIENTVDKIYTSEVENPFYFPALNINSMPSGVILATTAATKALSQGQFGQFPLYAFTTNGVWALEVAADGTYDAIKPVTRDVCSNIKSITQLDNAVLFVSDRGIMLLQGSETACITDGIMGEDAFDVSTLPHIKDSNIRPDLKNMTMSHDFLAGCSILYDYQNQHIIVFNPEERVVPQGGIDSKEPQPIIEEVYPYAFVFSFKSKTWGMMENNLSGTVNSYPEAMAINKNGQLVSFGELSDQTSVQGLLVTRPLKFGAPDIYKTIHTMKQNGMFQKGHVKTLLYASRDQHKWYLIASSVDEWIRGLRGTPWRWFRIALLTDLSKGESVSGAMVEFEAKETGKMH